MDPILTRSSEKLLKYLHKTNIKWIKYCAEQKNLKVISKQNTFSVWSVEDEEGSITVGEPVSTDIGPDLLLFVNVGLEDGTDDVIAFAISSPIDNDVICGGLEEDPFPEGAMEVGTRDAGILVGGCCFFLIQSL